MSATAIALDVGGTCIKGAAAAGDGGLCHTERWLTRAERGPEAVLETVLDRAAEFAERAAASPSPRREVGKPARPSGWPATPPAPAMPRSPRSLSPWPPASPGPSG